MAGHREGEWLDLVADLLTVPPTEWPDERVAGLLLESFDAVGGGRDYERVCGAPPVQREWPYNIVTGNEELAEFTRDEAHNPHPILRYFVATGRRHAGQVADVEDWFVDRRSRDRWYGCTDSQAGTPTS